MSASDSPQVAERRQAVVIAGHSGDRALVEIGLTDEQPSVRESALGALDRLGVLTAPTLEVFTTDIDVRVRRTTTHSEPLVREASVAALGAIGDELGLSAIIAACGDKPAIRRRAVLALAPFDTPEVKITLHKALEDRDWQVRQAAEDLLG